MLEKLNWQQTCCAWHGQYAEVKTKGGGMLRLKRAPDVDGVLCTRFGADGKAIDKDAEGVPEYVVMTEEEVLSFVK